MNMHQLKLSRIRASIWCKKMLGYLSLDINYLFLKARSFPQATLSENCLLLRTDNVPVNYVSIFSQQIEAIVYFYQHQQRLLKG